MKRITFVASILLLVTLLALSATVFADEGENILEIQVSPHTLNLASNGGTFSIHADVNYSSVAEVALTVEEAILIVNHTVEVEDGEPAPCYTFADDRGDLVVKCNLETVKGMVSAGEATFELEVLTDDGMTYMGENTIDVISRGK